MANETREPIAVYFRVFESGEVIALWRDEPSPGMISSYMHVGQHSAASPELIQELRIASAEEKRALTAELELIGYDVTDADE